MGRTALITRPKKLTVNLPEDVYTRVELYLFSTSLGRIPSGAWGKFITERVEEFFSRSASSTVAGEHE